MTEMDKELPLIPDEILRRTMGDRFSEPADIRYDDEDADVVARVFVRVEWKGGKVREYEAEDPQDFSMNDPEKSVSFHSMGMAVQGFGSPVVPMMAATPSLRLLFRGNPRRPMHIRTEATAGPLQGKSAVSENADRVVRLGKDAITGSGDGEVDVDPAMPEAGVDLAEDAPGVL